LTSRTRAHTTHSKCPPSGVREFGKSPSIIRYIRH